MSRTLILILLSLVASFVLVACTGSPTIVATPAGFDFGDIPAADIVTGAITIQNTGNRPLQIKELRTSCGCTVVTVGETTVAPGAETPLTIRFDPQAHPGLYGPLLRMIYVQSNDPNQPELEIPVTVTILSPQEASQ
ncbi:MAG: DUF1573 domain-containing protein [Caldilineaceae bacterium]|nr:DUF1573 domain-containing protein [Caldilineaceae bacterium]